MPESIRTRSRVDVVRPAGLGVALLLAIVASAVTATSSRSFGSPSGASWLAWRSDVKAHSAALADKEWGELRRTFPVGARVGWLVSTSAQDFMAREVDVQRFYGAQYALAPAILKPLYAPECRARGPWACGIGRVDYLLGPAGVAPVLGTRDIRFTPEAEHAGMVLLKRLR